MRWGGLIMASGLALFPLIILDVVIGGAYRVNPIVALKELLMVLTPPYSVFPTIRT